VLVEWLGGWRPRWWWWSGWWSWSFKHLPATQGLPIRRVAAKRPHHPTSRRKLTAAAAPQRGKEVCVQYDSSALCKQQCSTSTPLGSADQGDDHG
jgi:hypothetical protein